jgi:hypothetical protein
VYCKAKCIRLIELEESVLLHTDKVLIVVNDDLAERDQAEWFLLLSLSVW